MTQQEIEQFEKTHAQLEGLHFEIGALSKKSQNDALNKFKLKFVNQILQEANKLLGTKYKPFPDFNFFDESDVPTNSDATLIISQYLSCLENLRVENIIEESVYRGGKKVAVHYWKIGKSKSTIETYPPKKLK